MINTNYVPEWYISPFQHVQYTLARNQLHMDLLFEDVNNVDRFLSAEGAAAQVDFYSDGAYAVVQLGDTSERKLIEIYGLLLHEAVHVWQKVKNSWEKKSLVQNLKHIRFKRSLKTFLKCMKKAR